MEALASSTDDILQLVTFTLGNEEYAVDILKVQEINRMTEIAKVPNAPMYVEGVINLRGRVIPVVNLRQRFDNNMLLVITYCIARLSRFQFGDGNDISWSSFGNALLLLTKGDQYLAKSLFLIAISIEETGIGMDCTGPDSDQREIASEFILNSFKYCSAKRRAIRGFTNHFFVTENTLSGLTLGR